jgi:hypothetical protein
MFRLNYHKYNYSPIMATIAAIIEIKLIKLIIHQLN